MLLRWLVLVVSVASAASAETPKKDIEKSADPRSKMICKRFGETGSLVRTYKTCKTKADWDRERDAIRAAPSASGACNGPACG